MTSAPPARGGRASFWCGLASATAALIAGLFYFGWPPGASSGEAMLLLVFGAFPLAAVSFALALRSRRAPGRSTLAAAGGALALVTLVVVLLVLALVWLSWTRCASSCI